MRHSDHAIRLSPCAWWRVALPCSATLLLALAGAAVHPIPSARANEAAAKAVEVRDAWTRAVPAGARTAVGYLVLRNTSATPERLVASSSPAAERVEVHEAFFEGDIARRPAPPSASRRAGCTSC